MSGSEADLVKRLRDLADTGTFFDTWNAAPLLREAADMIEAMAQRIAADERSFKELERHHEQP